VIIADQILVIGIVIPLLKVTIKAINNLCFNGLVVSALGIRAPGPGYDPRFETLFRWVATLGKMFTHTASPQKGSFRRLSGYGDAHD